MRYKYVLELRGLAVNYHPCQYTARKGGIIGFYSSNKKAEARRDEFMLEKNEKEKEEKKSLPVLTKEDFLINKVEWD